MSRDFDFPTYNRGAVIFLIGSILLFLGAVAIFIWLLSGAEQQNYVKYILYGSGFLVITLGVLLNTLFAIRAPHCCQWILWTSILLGIATFIVGLVIKTPEPKGNGADMVYNGIKDVNRLELSRMTVGKVGMISDPSFTEADGFLSKAQAAFDAVKVGKRIGVYSYDTYLTAYIDLSELRPEDVEVDNEKMTARVTLPPVKVTVDGREPQLHEEHYRVTGLRSEITPAERAALKAQMSREVSKEINGNDKAMTALRTSAIAKADAWLSSLLENWGYTPEVEWRM